MPHLDISIVCIDRNIFPGSASWGELNLVLAVIYLRLRCFQRSGNLITSCRMHRSVFGSRLLKGNVAPGWQAAPSRRHLHAAKIDQRSGKQDAAYGDGGGLQCVVNY